LNPRARCGRLVTIAIVATALGGCAGPLQSRAGAFMARTAPVRIAGRRLSVTYITPVTPRTRDFLILFASGDAGYFGVSGEVIQHLAEQGYFLVTYDARQLVAREKKSRSRARIEELAAMYDTMLVDARRSLGIPDTVPVVVTGYSRGATLAVLAAALASLRHHLAGAIAISLTRRADYLERPSRADPLSRVVVDDKGRLQTYAAIPSAGSLPFALIQATEDSYVPAHEARRLFGPDTGRRRFYEVMGDHTFANARHTLMRDLDNALDWIRGIAAAN
jgi:alpha-beta hydrolase superfamily lysophospholipase